MLKRFAFIAITCISLAFTFGCSSEKIYVIDSSDKAQMGSSFNEETYVWQDFIFTTNRVEKVK